MTPNKLGPRIAQAHDSQFTPRNSQQAGLQKGGDLKIWDEQEAENNKLTQAQEMTEMTRS